MAQNVIEFIRFKFETFLDNFSIVSFDLHEKNVHKTMIDLMKLARVDSKNKSYYVSVNDLNTMTRNITIKNLERNAVAITSSTKMSNWGKTFKWMKNTRVNTGILVIVGQLDYSKIDYIQQIVRNMSVNSMFYLTYLNKKDIGYQVWNQIISLEGYEKGIMNPLTFDCFGRIHENFDMQGTNLKGVALNWEPYFYMNNCQTHDKDCRDASYVADVMNILGDMMNFTWESHRQEHNIWGTKPISGPPNSNGIWGGVIGDVFYGKYQISIR